MKLIDVDGVVDQESLRRALAAEGLALRNTGTDEFRIYKEPHNALPDPRTVSAHEVEDWENYEIRPQAE